MKEFVMDIINESGLNCNKIVIDDIEPDKRIFLIVDSEKYDIRTWNFRPFELDKKHKVCSEFVDYTLYKIIMDDDNNGHGEEVESGSIVVKWINN